MDPSRDLYNSFKSLTLPVMISQSILRFDSPQMSSVDRNVVLNALQDTIHRFNLDDKTFVRELNDNEFEVTGLEGLPLHSFTLRCEELGKKVDYEKRTVICVQ